jgi:small neutral amino acid transporter SnatA (MarC family)
VRLRTNLILVLALLVLGLAIFEFLRPSYPARIGPGTLLLIAGLLGVRYVFAKQAQKRSNMAKDVSPRPLGLADESSDQT